MWIADREAAICQGHAHVLSSKSLPGAWRNRNLRVNRRLSCLFLARNISKKFSLSHDRPPSRSPPIAAAILKVENGILPLGFLLMSVGRRIK